MRPTAAIPLAPVQCAKHFVTAGFLTGPGDGVSVGQLFTADGAGVHALFLNHGGRGVTEIFEPLKKEYLYRSTTLNFAQPVL